MLFNCDLQKPIYVLGQGVSTREKAQLLRTLGAQVIEISLEDFKTIPKGSQCAMGLASIETRKEFLNSINIDDYQWPSYCHDSALTDGIPKIGKGSYIEEYVKLSIHATIGDFSTICPFSMISHGTIIGNNNFIAPGCLFGGSTIVGDNVFFGLGCKIKDKITIVGSTSFAMDSTIIKSIDEPGNYVNSRKVKSD